MIMLTILSMSPRFCKPTSFHFLLTSEAPVKFGFHLLGSLRGVFLTYIFCSLHFLQQILVWIKLLMLWGPGQHSGYHTRLSPLRSVFKSESGHMAG